MIRVAVHSSFLHLCLSRHVLVHSFRVFLVHSVILSLHPSNPPIKDILQQHWSILESSPGLQGIANRNVKIGLRRNKNLRDILVSSKLRYPPEVTTTSHNTTIREDKICKNTQRFTCTVCPKLDKSGTCYNNITKRKYIIPQRFCCKMDNLVYLLSCNRCGKQYVGETCRTLRVRMQEHLRDIKYATHPDLAPPSIRDKLPTNVA